jgi:hypothetical protein
MPPFAAAYAPTVARAFSLIIEPMSRATRDHAFGGLPGDNEGAREVGVDHALPVAQLELYEWLAKLDAGVIDQDIYLYTVCVPLHECVGHSLFVSYIKGTALDVEALVFEPRHSLSDRIGARAVQYDAGSRGGKPFSEREADATRRAGDEGSAAAQIK